LFAPVFPPELLLRDQILPIRQSGGDNMNHTTTPAQREAMIALLELSRKYLTHPDVTALPFVLSSTTVAARITALLDYIEETS